MRLWRLSGLRRARDFDGGFGLFNAGCWNTSGRLVTYCATVPSLAALEKRVHVTNPDLLPAQAFVEYETPQDVPIRTIAASDLPRDWALRETRTQALGDEWLDSVREALLVVPSVVIAIESAPDRNVLINHRHSATRSIRTVAVTPFTFDARLF